ncbi:addiction module antidote protein, HI1420 [Thioploca ingrica]|uniref:Addiction module antidote protein, HI1420 n=1 Tax=Thioploca ingrica TaxID=40754 RepID=A0A090AMG1_9GAMM|nr:addiction module antidote protein, HI1420 [Thioploca ingrica]
MPVTIRSFDISKHLKTDEDIQGFLEEVISTGDDSDFIHALNIAARAKGMTEIAKQVGVTRASLYKSLSGNGNPRFKTTSKIVKALGCKLTVARRSDKA